MPKSNHLSIGSLCYFFDFNIDLLSIIHCAFFFLIAIEVGELANVVWFTWTLGHVAVGSFTCNHPQREERETEEKGELLKVLFCLWLCNRQWHLGMNWQMAPGSRAYPFRLVRWGLQWLTSSRLVDFMSSIDSTKMHRIAQRKCKGKHVSFWVAVC